MVVQFRPRALKTTCVAGCSAKSFPEHSVASVPGAKTAKFFGNGIRLRSTRAAFVRSTPCISSSAELAIEQSSEAKSTSTLQKRRPDAPSKSYYPKAADHLQINKPWFVIDAEGQTLGRLAVLAANHLRGKNVPVFTPSVDMGGYVVIVNSEKVVVSGNKTNDKLYKRHTTGRPGKMKVETFKKLQARLPQRIIEKAVKGMLPNGRLGRTLFTHLKVYKGTEHPHVAQEPEDITSQINKSFRKIAPLS